MPTLSRYTFDIIALRDERGSYNAITLLLVVVGIIALRDERGSYNLGL